MLSPLPDMLLANDGAFKTDLSPAIDAADLWDNEISSGSAIVGSPPETNSGSSASTDDSDIDIDIDTQPLSSGSHSEYGEAHDSIVLLMGREGVEFRCSKYDIHQHSTPLYEMITVHADGRQRIDLALSCNEIQVLVDTMNMPHLRSVNYWSSAALDKLVRTIELYVHYDFYEWDLRGIEHAILDRLEEDASDRFPCPRFDLNDRRFAHRLREIAEEQGMDRLLHLIDRAVPAIAGAGPYGDEVDERPRKWRKISTNCAVEVVTSTTASLVKTM